MWRSRTFLPTVKVKPVLQATVRLTSCGWFGPHSKRAPCRFVPLLCSVQHFSDAHPTTRGSRQRISKHDPDAVMTRFLWSRSVGSKGVPGPMSKSTGRRRSLELCAPGVCAWRKRSGYAAVENIIEDCTLQLAAICKE
jgi:hypothetical protein